MRIKPKPKLPISSSSKTRPCLSCPSTVRREREREREKKKEELLATTRVPFSSIEKRGELETSFCCLSVISKSVERPGPVTKLFLVRVVHSRRP
jgi:hypothetical protein